MKQTEYITEIRKRQYWSRWASKCKCKM